MLDLALLESRVQRRLTRWSVRQGVVVVGVSGGRDSLALLRVLRSVASQNKLQTHVGHLNHQLRGSISDTDEAWIINLARQWGLPCTTARRDVRTLAQQDRANIEATARRLRYQWLAELAEQLGATWIATAHHADDQAETVLHHLLRGSHWRGVRGIAHRRRLTPRVRLIRPLLTVPRAAIDDYVKANQLKYREDVTNQDVSLTRNRLRHQVLPLINTHYPKFRRRLCQLAARARREYCQLRSQARSFLPLVQEVDRMVVLPVPGLASQPTEVVIELLQMQWRYQHWPCGEMTRRHWQVLAHLCHAESGAIDLPGGLRAVRKRTVLQLFQR